MILSKIKWISYGETWKVDFQKSSPIFIPKCLVSSNFIPVVLLFLEFCKFKDFTF